jgi:hypothetical protein
MCFHHLEKERIGGIVDLDFLLQTPQVGLEEKRRLHLYFKNTSTQCHMHDVMAR